MAANAMIDFFSKHPDLKFKDFKQTILNSQTPHKMTASYSSNVNQVAYNFRDCIVSNFDQNSNFLEHDFGIEFLKELLNILSECQSGEISVDNLSRLTYLVHLSKSKCVGKDFWAFHLLSFNSIRIVSIADLESNKILLETFEKIKSSKIIKIKIQETVFLITGQQIFNLDEFFKNLQLIFFRSGLQGLNGFAGIDCVYVSQNRLEENIANLKDLLVNEADIAKITKLNFSRLIIHEMCHIMIRKASNDFNVSTPTLNCQDPSRPKILEAGVCAEKYIFDKRIAWIQSAKSPNFDLDYCIQFLDGILSGKDLKFDFARSGCFENHQATTLMAIDYDPESVELF